MHRMFRTVRILKKEHVNMEMKIAGLTIITNEHKNNDVVERIFMMMEKMAERIIKIEMTNQNHNKES